MAHRPSTLTRVLCASMPLGAHNGDAGLRVQGPQSPQRLRVVTNIWEGPEGASILRKTHGSYAGLVEHRFTARGGVVTGGISGLPWHHSVREQHDEWRTIRGNHRAKIFLSVSSRNLFRQHLVRVL